MRRVLGVITVLALAAMLLVPGRTAPALAQEAPGVTLEVSKDSIVFGAGVRLGGAISPASEGETISIIDHEGRERATTTTDEEGRYSVRLTPPRTSTYQARWLAALSEPATVKVRPKVGVRMRDVRLFDRAAVRGSIRPRQSAGRVTVRLFRDGRRVRERKVALRDGRFFKTSFQVRKLGRYRANATFIDSAGARGFDRSRRMSPPLPSLDQGSNNVYVSLLEQRLRFLGYHLDGTDGYYSDHTADAMRAFNKIEGRSRLGSVDSGTWRALAEARRPQPRYKTSGFHLEVDQTRQVLMTVRDGRVGRVIHVSTGRDGYTPDGDWRIYRKIAGYSGGRLYYPSYYEGRRALHGWPEVPTYNASHGCTRLPMWTAQWVYARAKMGTLVRIYH